jgi:hypothetical protein
MQPVNAAAYLFQSEVSREIRAHIMRRLQPRHKRPAPETHFHFPATHRTSPEISERKSVADYSASI